MHIHRKFWFIFFSLRITPFFNIEILPKWQIHVLLEQMSSTTSLKRSTEFPDLWNFVVMKDIPCRCAYPQEILIQFFFSPSYALFELRNLAKMKVTTGFLSDCLSLMLGIAIPCIEHSQAMLEHGVCELAYSFFHVSKCFLTYRLHTQPETNTVIQILGKENVTKKLHGFQLFFYCEEQFTWW